MSQRKAKFDNNNEDKKQEIKIVFVYFRTLPQRFCLCGAVILNRRAVPQHRQPIPRNLPKCCLFVSLYCLPEMRHFSHFSTTNEIVVRAYKNKELLNC